MKVRAGVEFSRNCVPRGLIVMWCGGPRSLDGGCFALLAVMLCQDRDCYGSPGACSPRVRTSCGVHVSGPYLIRRSTRLANRRAGRLFCFNPFPTGGCAPGLSFRRIAHPALSGVSVLSGPCLLRVSLFRSAPMFGKRDDGKPRSPVRKLSNCPVYRRPIVACEGGVTGRRPTPHSPRWRTSPSTSRRARGRFQRPQGSGKSTCCAYHRT